MRLHCFFLSEAYSCTLELAYFAGKIAKNRLVCKNAVALAYYGSCRLLVMGSFRYLEQIMSADKFPSIFSRQMEPIVYIFSRQLEAIVYIFPNFQNCARCEKYLKDNKHNSLHLGRKYARIFVLGHYLFLVTHSFPRATLSENCSLLGTVEHNVRGQISQHIFAPNVYLDDKARYFQTSSASHSSLWCNSQATF